MNLLAHISKNQHAYLIEGEREEVIDKLRGTLEGIFGVTMAGNPDYRVSHFESLGIDEARAIKEEQSKRAFSGEEKFFVISADALTREAQNALLKVFEEPTRGTYLFLIVPSVGQVIPTLLSRVRTVKFTTNVLTEHLTKGDNLYTYGISPEGRQPRTDSDAMEFLATDVEKRLQLPFIKEFFKWLSEDKNKQPIISFFDEIEKTVHDKTPADKMTKADWEFFAEIIKFRSYANDRSSSVKMLLEHVSLTAPVVK